MQEAEDPDDDDVSAVAPLREPLTVRRLVKTDMRILEPMQMEASFQYRLMIKHDGQVLYPEYYEVESYFIFPPQMRLAPHTYPVESFYRDLKSYINFRIPKLSFKEIMGTTDNPERSPLKKIREELEAGPLDVQRLSFIRQEAQIFASSFHTFVQRKSRRLQRLLEKTKRQRFRASDTEATVLAEKYGETFEESLLKIRAIYREWRLLIVNPQGEVLDGTLRPIDEYILHSVHDFLLQQDRGLADSFLPDPITIRWKHMLKTLLRALRMHSTKQGYQWVDEKSGEFDLEHYFYHRGSLKRAVWSALYLDTRTKPLFKLQRQAGAMIAAGVAGVWAVLADLSIRATHGYNNLTSGAIGLSTVILVSGLTLAYILKDRIKELGRGYFQGGLFGRLPDNSSKIIYQSNSHRKPLQLGFHDEKVRYINPSRIPDELNHILHLAHNERWEQEPHTIIRYTKRIGLRGKAVRPLKRKIRAIYTFFRLNVAHFLGSLDLPYEELLVPTRKLGATS
ncbi:MAG: hypothetical protein ACOVS5_18760, partial [Oligoflexus sp.]